MAVEKSYARLGLFLVVGARRDPRDGAALHPADAEPRGHRAGHLHAGERQPASTSRARCATAASPWGGCRTCRWSRAAARSRSTSSCSPIASRTRRRQCHQPPGDWPGRGVFRAAARPGGRQPRDRRGIPLARHAGEPPAADDARLHARPAVRAVDADAAGRSCGIGCPRCWSASRRRSRSFGRSSPGCPTASTGPTGSSPTSNASSARASCRPSAPTRGSSSRRPARRSRQIASNLDGLVGDEGTLSKFAEEARAAIKAADLPASGRATRDAMDQASLAAEDLRRSLPAMRESLEQLRELARQLQEQPESVVYGPRPAGAKPK